MVEETKRRNLNHATVASQMKTTGRNADGGIFFLLKEYYIAATQVHFLWKSEF